MKISIIHAMTVSRAHGYYIKESDKIIKLLTSPSRVSLNESLILPPERYPIKLRIHKLFSFIFKTSNGKKQTDIIFKYPEHASFLLLDDRFIQST